MTTPHPTRSKRATPTSEPGPRTAKADDVPVDPDAPTEPVVFHRWEITGQVPPAAWAALLVDMRAVLEVARAQRVKLAGPETTGQPILDADRIALTVKFGDRPWSAPFLMTRAPGPGEVRSPLGDAYDSLVLAALTRAGRHLGALITSTSEASPKAVAMSGRLVETLFGDADRALSGAPPLPTRTRLERIVAGALDAAEATAGGPASPQGYLGSVLAALQAEVEALTEPGGA